MAISDLSLKYPGQANTPTADYPQGSFKNDAVQGDGSGTPLDDQWQNDIQGYHSALLQAGEITPSNNIETANNSDLANAMKEIIKKEIDDRVIGWNIQEPVWYVKDSGTIPVSDKLGLGASFDGSSFYYNTDNTKIGQYFSNERYKISSGLTSNGESATLLDTSGAALDVGSGRGVFISPNGDKVFVIGGITGSATLFEYSMSGGDVTTINPTAINQLTIGNSALQGWGIFGLIDGLKLYLASSAESVVEVTLSAQWSLAGAAVTETITLADGPGIGGTTRSIAVSTDGRRLLVCSYSNQQIQEYRIDTPFDLSTVNVSSSVRAVTAFGGGVGDGSGTITFCFRPDNGAAVYAIGDLANNGEVYDFNSGVVGGAR